MKKSERGLTAFISSFSSQNEKYVPAMIIKIASVIAAITTVFFFINNTAPSHKYQTDHDLYQHVSFKNRPFISHFPAWISSICIIILTLLYVAVKSFYAFCTFFANKQQFYLSELPNAVPPINRLALKRPGRAVREDIVEDIFSRFCVGKWFRKIFYNLY